MRKDFTRYIVTFIIALFVVVTPLLTEASRPILIEGAMECETDVLIENHHAILGTTINETAEPVACGLVTILRFWYILKLPAEVG
jgi:PhoPQ-activated pathogenicity-related protein